MANWHCVTELQTIVKSEQHTFSITYLEPLDKYRRFILCKAHSLQAGPLFWVEQLKRTLSDLASDFQITTLSNNYDWQRRVHILDERSEISWPAASECHFKPEPLIVSLCMVQTTTVGNHSNYTCMHSVLTLWCTGVNHTSCFLRACWIYGWDSSCVILEFLGLMFIHLELNHRGRTAAIGSRRLGGVYVLNHARTRRVPVQDAKWFKSSCVNK